MPVPYADVIALSLITGFVSIMTILLVRFAVSYVSIAIDIVLVAIVTLPSFVVLLIMWNKVLGGLFQ